MNQEYFFLAVYKIHECIKNKQPSVFHTLKQFPDFSAAGGSTPRCLNQPPPVVNPGCVSDC